MSLITQRESEPLWFSAIAVPERVGRLLMDFGFGSLVHKFEERIGRRATSLLLWLAAVALFVTCARAVLLDGIIPLTEFLRGVSSESARSIFWTVVQGVMIAFATAFLLSVLVRLLALRILQKSEKAALHAKGIIDRADAALTNSEERSNEFSARAEVMIAKAEAAHAEMIAERDELNRLYDEFWARVEALDDDTKAALRNILPPRTDPDGGLEQQS